MNRTDFFQRVWDLAQEIPRGRVATYGQLAQLLGHPQYPRMVGAAMRYAPDWVPCHRVVGSDGRLCRSWPEQKNLLGEEGVSFTPSGRVDLSKFLWENL